MASSWIAFFFLSLIFTVKTASVYVDDVFHFDQQPDYMDRVLVAEPETAQNPLINQHKFTYIIDSQHCTPPTFLLVVVRSEPEHFLERRDVRDTWGSVTSYRDKRIRTVFMMGHSKYTDNGLQQELLKENTIYGDIVVGDFVEHFRNQTYKSIMGLSWFDTHCEHADYVLMTNDETMVDPYHLIDFLLARETGYSDKLLYCSTLQDFAPSRNPSDKLFVTMKDYPYDTFPPHCDNMAFVMSGVTAVQLLEAARTVTSFWQDHVYVTGLLALKANVTHTDMIDGHSYNIMQEEHINNDIGSSMFLSIEFRDQKQHWSKAWNAIQRLHKQQP